MLDLKVAVVAPFAGAWIEISASTMPSASAIVAPFAGAWIEILIDVCQVLTESSRSVRRSVD